MKVGIIVHSHTGNTLSVAQKLMEALQTAGHLVTIEQVEAVNEDPSAAGNIQLKTIPDPSPYDTLIFGAPVRAFSLSPVMKAYLAQVASLKGKKVGCFVTEQLPFSWMGGNQAIGQLKKAVVKKEANVFSTGVVNWSNKQRETKITEVIKRLIQ